MDCREAVEHVLLNVLDYKGRASKSEFWWFIIFAIVLFGALNLLGLLIGLFAILSTIINILLLIPLCTVTIRRLHDTDKSGLYALVGCIPLFGTLVLLYWLMEDGDSEANQYGGNPLDIDVDYTTRKM